MTLRHRPVDWAELPPCEHMVQFYDAPADLQALLRDYTADGLRQGEAAIVIATPQHLADLEQHLQDAGFDVVAARWQGQYLPMDARATLSQFMLDGRPDEALFTRTMDGVLARARRNGRRVRAFGEMVSLLWDDGLIEATIVLERMWDDLCRRQQVPLCCAYPRAAFKGDARKEAAFGTICHTHSRLVETA